MLTLLAETSISGSDALNLIIQLVICGVIFALILWFVGWVGIPEPFLKVVKVVLGLCILIFLINVLMGFAGHPMIHWR